MTMLNAFTVDVEDYFQVSAFADNVPLSQWDSMESRVEVNTLRILDLLDRYDVKGTFFIVGWTAERYPELVREICQRGHEIGTHSYWHQLVYEQTPEEFRRDLRKSMDCLQEISGEAIVAYRAPSFSITNQSKWALRILVEEGVKFDSSIFPVVHDRYGIPDAEHRPHAIEIEETGKSLCEFPPSVYRKWKFNWPVSGGGYFRLYPLMMTHRMLTRINSRLGTPFMFYIHPWEIDPDQPRIKASYRSRFRHYQNLKSTESKLERLLQRFRFGTLTEAWTSYAEQEAVAVGS
jgi:polysaccharide deacetylase family protein (PEP-CTERM system associated)